ncbi:MAG: acyl-ACP--UDP-N-acetylglucosamine O-acyltransferase [Gemmatimonadota bacterium]
MSTQLLRGVHPTAIVDDDARLADDVIVGPYAIIGPGVEVGARAVIGPHAILERNTTIGADCRIHAGAVLGGEPQDLKFEGEDTRVVIGERTVIREYVTVNRGTMARGRTDVGSDCLVMAYAHVAHDCVIGDRVVIANAVNMGGHVEIGDWAIVGGQTAIHQFVRIGAHAMVGGASAVRKDVPPYQKAAGNPLDLYGLNSVGLQRRGFSEASRLALKRASRMLFHSKENLRQAAERVRAEVELTDEVRHLLEFLEGTDRGTTL